jgi:light-regulated signal transduction histidine kinase (bacteriophytochrome)
MTTCDSIAHGSQQPDQDFIGLQKRLDDVERRLTLVTGERDALSKEMDDLARFLSHDLRAPLRGMDGYSTALIEDYSAKLDPMGLAYLQYIAEAGRQTSYLIDRLIYFMRLRSAPLQLQSIDLSQVANELAVDFDKSSHGRNLSWMITPGLSIQADYKMMRELMRILLENAWKFTSKHETACVEVGQVENDSQTVIFVRDDGAGFNMDFSNQLFMPFHRLHTGHDFDGAGMGLAIAQRIIQRHHGRIWAAAEVDHGATFYFSIEGEAI